MSASCLQCGRKFPCPHGKHRDGGHCPEAGAAIMEHVREVVASGAHEGVAQNLLRDAGMAEELFRGVSHNSP